MRPPILLIVPTRGRPVRAETFVDRWAASSVGLSDVVLCVDSDDPTFPEYQRRFGTPRAALGDSAARLWVDEPAHLGPWTNRAAVRHAELYPMLGSVGDDHRLTPGWEEAVTMNLAELGTGIVHCNDGSHEGRLPTAWIMTSDIVRALGWMVPPGIEHLYIDRAVNLLGREAGCMRYLPDVDIIHEHPNAIARSEPERLKLMADGLYERSNSEERWHVDGLAWDAWRRGMDEDDFDPDSPAAWAIGRVRALRGG